MSDKTGIFAVQLNFNMAEERFASAYQINHYKANLNLALPVMLSQAGQMVVVLADNLMVGQLGATQLAGAAFANNIFVVGMVFTMGLIHGLTPLTGKAFGSGNRAEAVNWLRQAFTTFPVISTIQAGIMAALVLFMPYMGQTAEVVKLAIPYYLVLVGSLIPFQFFFIFKQYAEGLGNTRIAMTITLTANIINILLNYIFIYGKLGMPALGLMGAGYATLISRLFMPMAFLILFFKLDFFEPDRDYWRTSRFNINAAVKLLKLGFPIAGQYIVEVLTFSLGSIMMGWLGEAALGAHQVVISLASLTYMTSAGLAAATTIKVSHFRGEKNFKEISHSVNASLRMVIVFMSLSVTMFLLFRFRIPALFVPDVEVISIAAGLMLVAGLFQIFDGIQVVSLGALRGLEDVKTPMLMVIIAYFPVALPISYISAFVLGWGPQGIWLGYMAGLLMAGIQLLLRFRWKTRLLKASD